MFTKFILSILGLKLPGHVGDLIVDVIKGLVWLVGELDQVKDAEGRHKLEVAIELGAHFVDEYLDSVPAWGALPESARDAIVRGLVESILFLTALDKVDDEAARVEWESGTDNVNATRPKRRAAIKALKAANVADKVAAKAAKKAARKAAKASDR